MKWCIPAAALVALLSTGCIQSAPPAYSTYCNCSSTGDCICSAEDCKCPNCPEHSHVSEQDKRFDALLTALERQANRPQQTQQVMQQQARTPVKQSRPTLAPQRYTGAHVCVRLDGTCEPCDRLKADLDRVGRESNWRVGFEEDADFRFIETDGIAPRIDYYRNGSLIDSVEGYPRSDRWSGYFGDIKSIVDRHPHSKNFGTYTRHTQNRHTQNTSLRRSSSPSYRSSPGVTYTYYEYPAYTVPNYSLPATTSYSYPSYPTYSYSRPSSFSFGMGFGAGRYGSYCDPVTGVCY